MLKGEAKQTIKAALKWSVGIIIGVTVFTAYLLLMMWAGKKLFLNRKETPRYEYRKGESGTKYDSRDADVLIKKVDDFLGRVRDRRGNK